MSESSLLHLVGELKAKGYYPVQWVKGKHGCRADEPGKFQVPAYSAFKDVCFIHGNAVRVIKETNPSPNKGVKILEIHPCFLCRAMLDAEAV